uniref:Uncharacterized protein n=1 Tax=Romanomermis culicivorax TaxID=13658 RepID=A0A915KZZ5_ROMCU
MGVDSSKGAGANEEILSSVSLRKSFICVPETVRSVVAEGSCGASGKATSGNLAMLRSKIGVSRSSSLDGSRVVDNRARLNNSSAISAHAEAVVGNGYA